MSKRQMPDLSALLAKTATPMQDAASAPLPVAASAAVANAPLAQTVVPAETATPNLENLNFKVPKSFRKRFRDCAHRADLKHNALLFAALDAWEATQRKN